MTFAKNEFTTFADVTSHHNNVSHDCEPKQSLISSTELFELVTERNRESLIAMKSKFDFEKYTIFLAIEDRAGQEYQEFVKHLRRCNAEVAHCLPCYTNPSVSLVVADYGSKDSLMKICKEFCFWRDEAKTLKQ